MLPYFLNAQVCDATGGAICTNVGFIKKVALLQNDF